MRAPMQTCFLDDAPFSDDDVTVSLDGDLFGEGFEAVLHEAARSPERSDVWERAESIARTTGRTDDVAAAYRAVLERRSPAARAILERAIAFHDAWVEDTSARIRLLERTLAIDPTLEEPFDRLCLLLAREARFADLLDVIDRVVRSPIDASRKDAILAEAAYVAETCTDEPERALAYAEERFARSPGNDRAAAELERMLLDRNAHRELVDLWTCRLAFVGEDERQWLRLRIAQTYLDALGDASLALDAVEPLLGDPERDDLACRLLAKIVMRPGVDETKRRAAALLGGRLAERRGAS